VGFTVLCVGGLAATSAFGQVGARALPFFASSTPTSLPVGVAAVSIQSPAVATAASTLVPALPTRIPTVAAGQGLILPTRVPTVAAGQGSSLPTRVPTVASGQGLILPTRIPTATATAGAARQSLRTADWRTLLTNGPEVRTVRGGSNFDNNPMWIEVIASPGVEGYVDVARIQFADLDGDGQEEAVVAARGRTLGAGTNNLVFRSTQAGPRLAATLRSSARFLNTIVGGQFQETQGLYESVDPLCCPSVGVEHIHYVLRGNQMVKVSTTRVPDADCLRASGKHCWEMYIATF
jgi:hypothetical protein